MSFETDMIALLNPLVGERVYWGRLPEGTRVTELTILLESHGGRGRVQYVEKEVADNIHARVRVIVICPDDLAACDLSRLVEKTIIASTFNAEAIGAFTTKFVQGVKLWEVSQDFGILYPDP